MRVRATLGIAAVAMVLAAAYLLLPKPTSSGAVVVDTSGQAVGAPGQEAGAVRSLMLRNAAQAGRLSGRVVVAEGEPPERAQVCATCASCMADGAEALTCVAADSEGHFELEDLEPTAYRLLAMAPGFLPGRANAGDPLRLGPGQVIEDVEIVLRAGGARLDGVVLDALGGAVSGARVRTVQWDGVARAVEVMSDDEGRFTVWGAPGQATLFVSAHGYAPTRKTSTAPSSGVEIRLSPGSSLEGKVVRESDGSPVQGAHVLARNASRPPSPSAPTTQSDRGGRFVIENLEHGPYIVEASGPSYRGQAREVAVVGLAQRVSDLTVPVRGAVAVQGRVVVGDTGEGCAAGRVTLGPPRPSPGSSSPGEALHGAARAKVPVLFANIGPGGEVRFAGVLPGRYKVGVRCEGHKFKAGPKHLDIEAEPAASLEWRVERGLGLSVLVVDARKEPVPGARIALVSAAAPDGRPSLAMPAVTGVDGRYEYPSELEPGEYRVEPAYGMAGDPVDVTLEAGSAQSEVVLELSGDAGLVVAVQTPDGKPIDGLEVAASAQQEAEEVSGAVPAPRLPGPRAAVPAGAGRYRIAPLSAGRYRVEVNDGVNPAVLLGDDGLIELTAGEQAEETVVLARDAEIRGRVVDQDGRPAPDVIVSVESADKDPLAQLRTMRRRVEGAGRTLTDASGRFVVPGIGRGTAVTVRAERPGVAGAVAREVPGGGEVELVLTPTTPSARIANAAAPQPWPGAPR